MTHHNKSPIMITGATGYVGSWIVLELLKLGHTLHIPVRDLTKNKNFAHLQELEKQHPGTLRFFEANLLQEGSYEEAMRDCELVFHTASPFKLKVKDAQKELIDPALQGTRNVLHQANKTKSVKRVVLTSSVVAIFGSNKELTELPGQTLTEANWNTSSSLSNNPYSYSKTVAEKAAWEIAKDQNQWDLVVINPSFVMGPSLNIHSESESLRILKQIGDGTLRTGMADIGVGLVDVRDVATAHINAAFSENANGRYIICGHNTSFTSMSQTLLPKFGDQYPIPKSTAPKWLIWLFGPLMGTGLTRQYISDNVNYAWRADNRKSIQDLNLTYRPMEETMVEAFQQLIDEKVL